MRNYDGLTPPISDYVIDVNLAANTARSIPWPAGANYANVSGLYPTWIAGNKNTAQVPSGDVGIANSDGIGSAYNKAQFARGGDEAFSIISANAQVISIEFWS